jgi:hypothetical protein
MRNFHNIEKSAFRKGEYVGYSSGIVFRIAKCDGGWYAWADGVGRLCPPLPTLRDVSLRLENFIPCA